MQYYPISEKLPKQLPENPGIYIFRDTKGTPIYIGKAKNLKSRVSSYFGITLAEKTAAMRAEATQFSYILVTSEIEALLLEAKLVRDNMPKYNSELKDDKSPLYIGITKEEYPRVVSLRRTQIPNIDLKYIFGPFTQAGSTRSVMRNLRRIFHYSNHKPGKRVCIYRQIGLCNPCPSEIVLEADLHKKLLLKKQYQKNISMMRKFLLGNFNSVKKSLEKEMKTKSISEEFELAYEIKKQIELIDQLTTRPIDPMEYIKDPNLLEDIRKRELSELKKLITLYLSIEKLQRIECFDIAHLSGTHPTASMVTFIDGEPDKKYYRHFKVKRERGNSDVDSMKHILKRRALHWADWGKPDLIIVDGGKPQVSAALEVILDIPLVGLAKQFETIVIKTDDKFVEVRLPRGNAKNLVQRMRDEAHRFARRLHHKHVSEQFIKK